MRTRPAIAFAAGAGALTAASLPPFRLWWLAVVGYAGLGVLLDRRRRGRLAVGGMFFLAFFVVGLAWMVEFSLPGAVLLVLLETAICAACVAVLPKSRGAALVALPGVVVLGEIIRYKFPLGGLPMAGPALGQVDGPLLPFARIGGDFALVFLAAALGSALAAVAVGWRTQRPGVRRTGTGAFAGLALLGLAPPGLIAAPEPTAAIRVAYVQGGGVRGLRAVENTFTDVYGNQVDAQAKVKSPVDLVVWPEDVIDLPGPVSEDDVRFEMGNFARRLGATVVAGVVEDFRSDRFKNAAVAWDRSGKIVDRYDKVHRVPFGEYVPARGLVSKLADLSAVPRDAYPGSGDGVLLTRGGDQNGLQLGVTISYEVFFPERARIATRGGGELLLVPTNASSFKGRQVPAQEVAAARLRAVEMGRDLVQAAPTGTSVFVDANGNTSKESKLGAAAVAQTTLQRRTGTTPYVRFGDVPMVLAVVLVLLAGLSLDRSVKKNK